MSHPANSAFVPCLTVASCQKPRFSPCSSFVPRSDGARLHAARCARRAVAPPLPAHTVRMSSRRPGGKNMPYYNSVRVSGVPTSYSGNGVSGNGLGETLQVPSGNGVPYAQAEQEDIKSMEGKMPISLFGKRFGIPGRLVLFTVPFMWGSYSICLKCLYAMPWSISAPLFNSLRLALAAVVVLPAMLSQLWSVRGSVKSFDAKKVTSAGFELGLYTFLVNILQIFGLRHTTASRGAFLGQLATIMVPIAAYALGMEPRLGWNVCIAAVMAVCGVGCLTLDSVSAPFSLRGDGLLLLTAVAGSAYILRSKQLSKTGGPLVEMKVFSQAVLALGFLAVNSFGFGGGSLAIPSIGAIFAGATPALIAANVAIVLWAGVVVSLMSTALQIRAQALVSASEAVLIFTFTPLWVAALAIPLGERFGMRGLIGAGLILASTLLASRPNNEGAKAKAS